MVSPHLCRIHRHRPRISAHRERLHEFPVAHPDAWLYHLVLVRLGEGHQGLRVLAGHAELLPAHPKMRGVDSGRDRQHRHPGRTTLGLTRGPGLRPPCTPLPPRGAPRRSSPTCWGRFSSPAISSGAGGDRPRQAAGSTRLDDVCLRDGTACMAGHSRIDHLPPSTCRSVRAAAAPVPCP